MSTAPSSQRMIQEITLKLLSLRNNFKLEHFMDVKLYYIYGNCTTMAYEMYDYNTDDHKLSTSTKSTELQS
jgi:hypothetical protein